MSDTATVSLNPLSLVYVGMAPNPIAFQIQDRRTSDRHSSTYDCLSLVERAVLRALCVEAIANLDRLEAATPEAQP
jgi:hypothetical protein